MSRASELKKKVLGEQEASVQRAINDLIDIKASDNNKDQGKLVQILKGLAFSDDPEADKFMKRLTDMISDKNFGDLSK